MSMIRLKELRKQKGISQIRLSFYLPTHPSHVGLAFEKISRVRIHYKYYKNIDGIMCIPNEGLQGNGNPSKGNKKVTATN